MKKLLPAFFLVFCVILLVPADGWSQAYKWTKLKRYATVSGSLGGTNYFGEIAPESHFASLRTAYSRPNLGVHYSYKFDPRVGVRTSFTWGRLLASDIRSAGRDEAENLPRFKRNLSFRNDIKELALVATFNLFQQRKLFTSRPDYTPYGFIGIAGFHHNPKAYTGGAPGILPGWYALQPLGTEGQNVPDKGYPKPYKRIQVAIPVGLGIKYRLDRHWDFGIEVGWRKTFTDYLDDISGYYADKDDLNAVDPTGRSAYFADRSKESGFSNVSGYGNKGDQRGDLTKKDWYIISNISLNYILPARIRGPKFK